MEESLGLREPRRVDGRRLDVLVVSKLDVCQRHRDEGNGEGRRRNQNELSPAGHTYHTLSVTTPFCVDTDATPVATSSGSR